MRVVIIAMTKRSASSVAIPRDAEVVAILTPRARTLPVGAVADAVYSEPDMPAEILAELGDIADTCLPTSGGIDMVAATEKSIEAATHLTDADAGAIEALRALARKIDAWDQIVEWALEDAAEKNGRPSVPQNDNVSISAYLKYCDQLGLSPAGRNALGLRERGVSDKKAKLTALRGGKTA